MTVCVSAAVGPPDMMTCRCSSRYMVGSPNPGARVSNILKDFRDFIGKGSAIDLAVGLIVGSAIGSILKSFVDELVIPFTGLLGKVDFANTYFVLKGDVPLGAPLAEARKLPGVVVLGYGQFLTVTINTLVLAFAVFLVVRAVNNLRKRIEHEEAAAPTTAAPSKTELLLGEIRDLLKKG
jgi:large conductance mechanosensitive channel